MCGALNDSLITRDEHLRARAGDVERTAAGPRRGRNETGAADDHPGSARASNASGIIDDLAAIADGHRASSAIIEADEHSGGEATEGPRQVQLRPAAIDGQRSGGATIPADLDKLGVGRAAIRDVHRAAAIQTCNDKALRRTGVIDGPGRSRAADIDRAGRL